ncbi:hypothetical protein AB6A40_001288 [Gnathostoma spinigerum]|uniref:Uncharacterized protein n=1 Tax=Gnathostoma spinigerum TaxID=75299 RepID=A0ABD6E3S9_9BILA
MVILLMNHSGQAARKFKIVSTKSVISGNEGTEEELAKSDELRRGSDIMDIKVKTSGMLRHSDAVVFRADTTSVDDSRGYPRRGKYHWESLLKDEKTLRRRRPGDCNK